MIHVIGDLVQSIGVFLASVLIKFYVSLDKSAYNLINYAPNSPSPSLPLAPTAECQVCGSTLYAALLRNCDYDNGAAVPRIHFHFAGRGATSCLPQDTATRAGQHNGCQVSQWTMTKALSLSHSFIQSINEYLSFHIYIHNLLPYRSVHHLNVWQHTSEHSVLMAHLVVGKHITQQTFLSNLSPLYN